MKQKTIIQEVLDALRSRCNLDKFDMCYIEGLLQDGLYQEKQQIINAHSEGIKFMAGNTSVPQKVSEEYFNKTYTDQ